MLETLIAAWLVLAADAPAISSGRQVAVPQAIAPVDLEDVTVTGRRLETMIQDFVSEVAAPNRGRNLARWDRRVCVGVVNFQTEAAQYVADRISTVAQDVGLSAGAPGCRPNILVLGTHDGKGLAQALVAADKGEFLPGGGGGGMDRGGAALRRFEDGDQPVRWWQIAVPTDEETGARAVRVPGDCLGVCAGPGSVLEMVPVIRSTASRLRSSIVDNFQKAIVVVDVDEVAGLSALQLADYIAMVTLAQIDPDADTSTYASILNVVDDPESTVSLTDWDTAYLGGLYAAQRGQRGLGSGRSEVVGSIRREHARIRATDVSEEIDR